MAMCLDDDLYLSVWFHCFVQVWAGTPAKFLRKLTEEEQQFIKASASNYSELANKHKCKWDSTQTMAYHDHTTPG